MFEIKCLASSSHGNCYLVSDGKTKLLLDAGIRIKDILIGCDFDVSSISGALITHSHKDHALSVLDLAQRGVRIYGPPSVIVKVADENNHVCVRTLIKYSIGTMDFAAVEAVHDVPCYIYYIRSLVDGDSLLYATDTACIPAKFDRLSWAILEANYGTPLIADCVHSLKQRILSTHMAVEELARYLGRIDQSRLKEIYLAHLSDDHSDEDMFRDMIQKAAPEAVIKICKKNGGTA